MKSRATLHQNSFGVLFTDRDRDRDREREHINDYVLEDGSNMYK